MNKVKQLLSSERGEAYVGEAVKQEDIRAKFESGVLKLSIPKAEMWKPQVEEKKYISIEG